MSFLCVSLLRGKRNSFQDHKENTLQISRGKVDSDYFLSLEGVRRNQDRHQTWPRGTEVWGRWGSQLHQHRKTLPMTLLCRRGNEWPQTSLSWPRTKLQLLGLFPVSPRESSLPLRTSVSSSIKYETAITLYRKLAELNTRWATDGHTTVSDTHPLSVWPMSDIFYPWSPVSRNG